MLFGDTAHALRARAQTVTRRIGIDALKEGDLIDAVSDMWMLNHPGRIVPIARLLVVSVRDEPLSRLLDDSAYAKDEMIKSSYPPGASLRAVIADFISRHRNMTLSSRVTRIEFSYV